ncbi:MAG TPA: hypothetical protein VG099_06070 [Gemmataceae bacterium]|jgi:hypothetical protein|nr:hypothetical protein [Gemmataceae bacterium]
MKLNAGWLKLLAIVALLGFCCGMLQAEDKKASATGTWKWTRKNQNGDEQQLKVKLKQDGDKLTGKLTGPMGNEVEIKEGKVKDGEVSFQVTFDRDGTEITAKFHGKMEGDKITGKVEVNDRTLDWEPTRAKDDK